MEKKKQKLAIQYVVAETDDERYGERHCKPLVTLTALDIEKIAELTDEIRNKLEAIKQTVHIVESTDDELPF